jgi:hypothetical protein
LLYECWAQIEDADEVEVCGCRCCGKLQVHAVTHYMERDIWLRLGANRVASELTNLWGLCGPILVTGGDNKAEDGLSGLTLAKFAKIMAATHRHSKATPINSAVAEQDESGDVICIGHQPLYYRDTKTSVLCDHEDCLFPAVAKASAGSTCHFHG